MKKIKGPKTNNFKITADDLHLRNYLHFEVQKNTRAQVFQDKRKKDPKHKGKIFSED